MWESIIKKVTEINGFINNIVWGWPAIILILGTGLLLTIKINFFQIRHFKEALDTTIVPTLKNFKKQVKNRNGKEVSQFEAFSAAISGTVGTGNIIGVTAAILTGGPGAVFWMWVSAFFGMITNFAENVLGLYYRKKEKDGSFSGGAFYYIYYGLKWKWLGYIAAVFCMLAAIGMSGAQTNKISGTISYTLNQLFNIDNSVEVKLIVGIIVAALTATIIIGGIKRIGKVASKVVPFMSLLFIVMAIITIFRNITVFPSAFASIFKYAFNFKAAGSGIIGYAFATVIRKGMARGVFSNEAGLGSSVVAHSASETREPVVQGLWGIFEVFFDTFVICTLSALMFLTTIDINSLTGLEDDTATAISVFTNNFGTFGLITFSLILPLFAYTTILAWSYYGEKATEFCFSWLGDKGKKCAVVIFKIIYILLIVASAVIESTLAWDISDTSNGLMAIPNLICLIVLSGKVVQITKNYCKRKKGEDLVPILNNDPELNEEFINDIKK